MCGAPDWPCRMTKISTPIASIFLTVSRVVSPFETLDPFAVKLIVSADILLAASSKLILVLVDGSKKSRATTLPLNVGTFLIERVETSRKLSAVSRRSARQVRTHQRQVRTARGRKADYPSGCPRAKYYTFKWLYSSRGQTRWQTPYRSSHPEVQGHGNDTYAGKGLRRLQLRGRSATAGQDRISE